MTQKSSWICCSTTTWCWGATRPAAAAARMADSSTASPLGPGVASMGSRPRVSWQARAVDLHTHGSQGQFRCVSMHARSAVKTCDLAAKSAHASNKGSTAQQLVAKPAPLVRRVTHHPQQSHPYATPAAHTPSLQPPLDAIVDEAGHHQSHDGHGWAVLGHQLGGAACTPHKTHTHTAATGPEVRQGIAVTWPPGGHLCGYCHGWPGRSAKGSCS